MDPINEFLNYLGLYTENPWIMAAILFLGGTLAAMIIKFIVRGMLHQTGIDEKLARVLGLRDTNTEQAISQFIFLLLMLVVVIISLNTAGLYQVTERLQALIDPLVQALPKLLFATLLALLTWVVATLVKNILQGILTASRLDARLGLDESRPLSRAIVTVVVSLIVLLMLPSILNALGIPEVSGVLNPLITQIWSSIPGLVFGGLIIAFGVFVASIVRKMVTAVLEGIRLDNLPAALGYRGTVNMMGLSLSSALGVVAMISIIVTMTAQGLQVMQLEFVSGLALLLRNLWAATLIFLIGLFLADLAKKAIGAKNLLFGTIAQYLVTFLFGGMALQRAEITPLSTHLIEYFVKGAIIAAVIAFGIGGAIAVGLGGKERVKRYLESK